MRRRQRRIQPEFPQLMSKFRVSVGHGGDGRDGRGGGSGGETSKAKHDGRLQPRAILFPLSDRRRMRHERNGRAREKGRLRNELIDLVL